jgi:site-specific recombinase XerD
MHYLRHTFASWLLTNPDIALTTVRDLMGHSSLAVTSKYAHMRTDTFEAVNRTLGGDNKGDSIAVRH